MDCRFHVSCFMRGRQACPAHDAQLYGELWCWSFSQHGSANGKTDSTKHCQMSQLLMVQKSHSQPPFGCIKPSKWWDKLPFPQLVRWISLHNNKKKVDCGIPNPVWYKVGEEPQLLRPVVGVPPGNCSCFWLYLQGKVCGFCKVQVAKMVGVLSPFFSAGKRWFQERLGWPLFLVQTVRPFQSTRTAQDIAMLKAWVLEMTVVGVSKLGIWIHVQQNVGNVKCTRKYCDL